MDKEIDVKIVFEPKSRTRSLNSRNVFCIEGGGTKGIFAVGILKYLFEKNPSVNLQNIDIFGGTSVGSYLAAALSLGYSQEDITKVVKLIDIRNLIDGRYMLPITIWRFVTRGYFYDDIGRETLIKTILNFRIEQIRKDLGESDVFDGKELTFGHLKQLIKSHPTIYKQLLINAVDINQNVQLFMSTLNDHWDEITLFDALMASSSIPFVFNPTILYYNPGTDRYTYRSENALLCKLIDGGVSTNNPLDHFLLNNEDYKDCNLWLLKFTATPRYTNLDGTMALLQQVANYLISEKNDTKMKLVCDQYNISTVNLRLNVGTFDLYTPDEMLAIIEHIYQKCVAGEIHFN